MRYTVHRTLARSILRSAAVLFIGVVATALLTAAPAAATARTGRGTTCDPAYGCAPPPPGGGLSPTCTVSATAAHTGDVISATLANVAVGVHVRLLFDGQAVAEGDTVAVGSSGGITLMFTIPANTSDGPHTLVFVGAGIQCDPLGGAGLQVSGEQFLARSDTSPSPGNSGGSLARTGVQIALLLAIALALFLVGSAVVRAARRRRRRIERARERERQRHRLRV
jgi:hypothetical protein